MLFESSCLSCIFNSVILVQDEADADAARGLVHEVYELVADNYLDARSGGFDPLRYAPAFAAAALASGLYKALQPFASHICLLRNVRFQVRSWSPPWGWLTGSKDKLLAAATCP